MHAFAQSALVGLLLPLAASARKITIVNSCRQTIWPGMYSNPGPRPDHVHGWEMKPGSSEDVEVSDSWNAGRIWARTGCVIQDGNFDCLTGNCGAGGGGAGLNGDMDCVNTNEIASLAEFTLSGHADLDNYDISHVDGFNLPMSITPSVKSCRAPSCKVNINEICPEVLRGGIDDNGANMMCMSSCAAGFGDTPAGNRACCDGGYKEAPDSCLACGVDYYEVFKESCPDAYAHAYDERSETSLWTCDSKLKSDYTIEFCPGSESFIGATKASDQYASSTATCELAIPGGNLAVRPSPTAGRPKGHLNVKVEDGAVPKGAESSAGAAGSGASQTSSAAAQTSASAGPRSGASAAPTSAGHQSASASAPAQQSAAPNPNPSPAGGDHGQSGAGGQAGGTGGGHGNGDGNGASSAIPEEVDLAAQDAPSLAPSPVTSPVASSSVPSIISSAPAGSGSPGGQGGRGAGGRGGRKQCPAKRRSAP